MFFANRHQIKSKIKKWYLVLFFLYTSLTYTCLFFGFFFAKATSGAVLSEYRIESYPAFFPALFSSFFLLSILNQDRRLLDRMSSATDFVNLVAMIKIPIQKNMTKVK